MAPVHWFAALSLALAAAAAWPQSPVTVQLHHRNAESLITALQPLIGPATLAGVGMQLQVRAPPSDAARVMRLIEQSDRPLQPLVVRLRDDPAFAPAPAAGAVASASAGELTAPDRSVTLSTGRAMPPDPHGNARVLSTQPDAAVELLEGDPLSVSMPAPQSLWVGVNARRGGPKRPTPAAAPGSAAGGGASGRASDAAAVVHFDAVSDFTVRIWLAGDTVAIDLRPRAAGRLDGAPDPNSEPVTVYGRLGQWIALADSGGELQATGNAESGAARAGLWIKVDRAPRPPGSD
jgi:hypothetical protein